MTKSIVPSFKKWTTDERRLMVVFLLTLIYPVFVTSFFALYLFVLMPVMVSPLLSFEDAHHLGWYHMYWLFVSMLWVILCVLIFPFFKKKNVLHMMTLGNLESSSHTQPAIKVEVKDEEGSQGNLSQKSENSSDNIKKAISDLESEKESLGKSRESLGKLTADLDRKTLTQSGEFLNDCMSTINSEDAKENETVCEIHVEESKEAYNDKIGNDSDQEKRELTEEEGDHQSEKDSEDGTRKDEGGERTSDIKDMNTKEPSYENKEEYLNKYSDNSSESSDGYEDVESRVSSLKAKQPHTSSPLKINKAAVEQHEDIEESEMTEEVDKLESNLPKLRQEKVKPTIDTSRASGYHECSMPTPKSVDRNSSQNNTVFLFINPETATTEDGILVSHGGEVEGSAVEKTDP